MNQYWKTAYAAVWIAGMSAAALAQDVTYRKDVKPLFDAKCAGCHGAASPYFGEFMEAPKKFAAAMQGPRMDSYANLIFFIGWPDTGALMRRLDDGASTGGKPGNMYQFLGSTDAERARNLNTFKAWVGPDGWTMKRWEARSGVPGITREELDKIRVKY